MRACALDLSDKSRNGNRGRETHEQVNMIINAANCHRRAAELAAFFGDYTIERRLDLGYDQGEPIPSCPNTMQI
jgi:hypothetical protein